MGIKKESLCDVGWDFENNANWSEFNITCMCIHKIESKYENKKNVFCTIFRIDQFNYLQQAKR